MRGVLVEKAGAPFTVVDGIKKPSPSTNQVLVKSIATAINPVDLGMQATGMLATEWPIVLGCDAAGVVVEVGKAASSSFKVGDEFLMDAPLTIPKPKNISILQAATIGVGSLTACLGLFAGMGLDLPDPTESPQVKDEWLIILGGAGSVGQYAVQLARLCGYKVLASCSPKNAALVTKLGADKTFDYRQSEAEQLHEIETATDGRFSRVFDTAAKSADFAFKALTEVSIATEKYFATTGNSSAITAPGGIKMPSVDLGVLGRTDAPTVNGNIESYIPTIVRLVEAGKLVPNDVELVGNGGFESVVEALQRFHKTGPSGQKYVVKLQNP